MVWFPPCPVLCLAGTVAPAASPEPSSVAPDVPGRLKRSMKDPGVTADSSGRGIAGWDGEKSP